MPAKCPYCAETIAEGAKKCPHCNEWLDASSANEQALACPRCAHACAPALGSQKCGGCGRSFFLFAGPRVEASRSPKLGDGRTYTSKSAGIFMRYQAEVQPRGFAHGPLDPITGYVPLDTTNIPFDEVGTIATWKRLDWVPLILTTIFMVPVSLLLIAGTLKEPAFAILGLLWWSLTGFLLWRAILVGACFMRVCSAKTTLRFRYDSPFWRRRTFFEQALLRSGIPAPLS